MRILVDGDIIVYRVGFASQHAWYDWYHPDDMEPRGCMGTSDSDINVFDIVPREAAVPLAQCSDAKEAKAWLEATHEGAKAEGAEVIEYVRVQRIEVDPIEHCLHSCKVVMTAIQEKYPQGQMEVYLSCSTADNWRTELYPEYKANRKAARRPVYYAEIQEYMNNMYPCSRGFDTEADDIIAMRASVLDDFVVVTIDKDMDQIPGLHYNWVKEDEYEMDEQAARTSVCLQAIHGDSTDNIKGIPKWGPAAARAWLENCPLETTEEIIHAAYATHYPPATAKYQALLNTALVSLPRNSREIRDWAEDVTRARQESEAAAEDSGDNL